MRMSKVPMAQAATAILRKGPSVKGTKGAKCSKCGKPGCKGKC